MPLLLNLLLLLAAGSAAPALRAWLVSSLAEHGLAKGLDGAVGALGGRRHWCEV